MDWLEFDTVKEKISELEDTTRESTQNEIQREKASTNE